MNDNTGASSVRDATDLIFAAEELMDLVDPDQLGRVAAAIDRIARAAKALRPNHLDDALDHVVARATYVEGERVGWTQQMTLDVDDRDDRHVAAVDALVEPVRQDVDALAERVRGAV